MKVRHGAITLPRRQPAHDAGAQGRAGPHEKSETPGVELEP